MESSKTLFFKGCFGVVDHHFPNTIGVLWINFFHFLQEREMATEELKGQHEPTEYSGMPLWHFRSLITNFQDVFFHSLCIFFNTATIFTGASPDETKFDLCLGSKMGSNSWVRKIPEKMTRRYSHWKSRHWRSLLATQLIGHKVD